MNGTWTTTGTTSANWQGFSFRVIIIDGPIVDPAVRPLRELGLGLGASGDEIRGAYRRLARDAHPDTAELPDPRRFQTVHEAYLELRRLGRVA